MTRERHKSWKGALVFFAIVCVFTLESSGPSNTPRNEFLRGVVTRSFMPERAASFVPMDLSGVKSTGFGMFRYLSPEAISSMRWRQSSKTHITRLNITIPPEVISGLLLRRFDLLQNNLTHEPEDSKPLPMSKPGTILDDKSLKRLCKRWGGAIALAQLLCGDAVRACCYAKSDLLNYGIGGQHDMNKLEISLPQTDTIHALARSLPNPRTPIHFLARANKGFQIKWANPNKTNTRKLTLSCNSINDQNFPETVQESVEQETNRLISQYARDLGKLRRVHRRGVQYGDEVTLASRVRTLTKSLPSWTIANATWEPPADEGAPAHPLTGCREGQTRVIKQGDCEVVIKVLSIYKLVPPSDEKIAKAIVEALRGGGAIAAPKPPLSAGASLPGARAALTAELTARRRRREERAACEQFLTQIAALTKETEVPEELVRIHGAYVFGSIRVAHKMRGFNVGDKVAVTGLQKACFNGEVGIVEEPLDVVTGRYGVRLGLRVKPFRLKPENMALFHPRKVTSESKFKLAGPQTASFKDEEVEDARALDMFVAARKEELRASVRIAHALTELVEHNILKANASELKQEESRRISEWLDTGLPMNKREAEELSQSLLKTYALKYFLAAIPQRKAFKSRSKANTGSRTKSGSDGRTKSGSDAVDGKVTVAAAVEREAKMAVETRGEERGNSGVDLQALIRGIEELNLKKATRRKHRRTHRKEKDRVTVEAQTTAVGAG